MRQRAPYPLVVAVCGAVLAVGVAVAAPVGPSAVVGWPASAGLLVGEVVTGGASGSDEFAELYNASSEALDLGGLELVYVTTSGATVTRKATWVAGTLLPPGAHLLVANSSGIYAPLADALYSGGFAAAGGALVLRPIGGSPIDALGWGDAANPFVEGNAAPAPPPGQSMERRPGDLLGNAQDTNDNATDFFVNAVPAAQSLAAPPVPAPQPTASPFATPVPSSSVEPTSSDVPKETADPTEEPTTPPTNSPPPAPTTVPTGTPAPTASPTPTISPTPTASPTPTFTVAQARAEPNGTTVDIIATLTTMPGLVESGTGAFLQDGTGGIALYLASASWPPVGQGMVVRVHGTVDERYSQRTIRLASGADVAALGEGVMPMTEEIATGAAGEAFEGALISVSAEIVTGADALSDGIAVWADDGTGRLRIVATAITGIAPSDLPLHGGLRLSGPLGQRDSSGTGTEGYRLYLRSLLDVEPTLEPSPTPVPSADPSAEPTVGPSPLETPEPSPTATASPTATSSPTVAPSPSATPRPVLAIAAARTLPVGSLVTVEGTATVEVGRLLDERSTAIHDASAGIVVHLPKDGWPAFGRGALLRMTGVLAEPYGNLELRPAAASAITVLGTGVLPSPRIIVSRELGEVMEGRLVRASGLVVSVDPVGAAGNFGVDLKDPTGQFRVFIYGTTGLEPDVFVKGRTVEVTGIEGQHASGSTAGHRIWPRDRLDARAVAPTPGSPVPSGSAVPSAPSGPGPAPGADGSRRVAIARAIQAGGTATIEGAVTTPAGFVDADGRRIVVEDPSGAVLVRLPAGATAPAVGARIVAVGTLGSYYGSPQLELAEAPTRSGTGSLVPRVLDTAPGPELAWRLVRVNGRVTSVHRLGQAWRAEVTIGGAAIPIYGGPRSGIPSTALVDGRLATVTGVLRPPYPTATDRRPAIAPRFGSDVSLGTAVGIGAPAADGSVKGGGGTGGPAEGASASPLDVDLAELGDHEASLVRVGGFVVSATATRIVIDDGTAAAAILLPSEGLGAGVDLRPRDPLNATGLVIRDGEAWAVAPRSPADIARVGRLGELVPLIRPTPRAVEEEGTAAPESLASESGWPPGALPTAFALAGTGLTVLMRRRSTIQIGRKLITAASSRWGRS